MKKNYLLLILLLFFISSSKLYAQEPTEADKLAAAELKKSGDRLQKMKRFGDALVEYEKALSFLKNDPKLLYEKANCLLAEKDTTKAINTYELVVSEDIKFTKAYLKLANVYKSRYHFTDAAKNFEEVAKYTKDVRKRVKYLLYASKMYTKSHEYESAASSATRAVKLMPANMNAATAAVHANNKAEFYDLAIKYAEQVIAGLPVKDENKMNIAKMNYEIAYAYFQQKNYTESSKYIEKANYGKLKSKVRMLTPDYYYKLAEAYYQGLDYEKSREHLEFALEINDKHIASNKLLGLLVQKEEVHTAALEHFKKALDNSKEEKDVENIGQMVLELLFDDHKHQKVVETASSLIKQHPTLKILHYYKAQSLYKLSKYDEGISVIKPIVDNPSNTPAESIKYNFIMARMYRAQKDYDKALEAFKKASKGAFAYAARKEYQECKDEKLQFLIQKNQ